MWIYLLPKNALESSRYVFLDFSRFSAPFFSTMDCCLSVFLFCFLLNILNMRMIFLAFELLFAAPRKKQQKSNEIDDNIARFESPSAMQTRRNDRETVRLPWRMICSTGDDINIICLFWMTPEHKRNVRHHQLAAYHWTDVCRANRWKLGVVEWNSPFFYVYLVSSVASAKIATRCKSFTVTVNAFVSDERICIDLMRR